MEDNKTRRNVRYIELRSEEVQELMGKIPPAIIRVGISMVLLIVVLLIALSCFVKYPEVMTVEAKLYNTNNIMEVRAGASGLYHAFGELRMKRVAKGDTLFGVMANMEDKNIIYKVAETDGYAFPCGILQDGVFLQKDSLVCLIADTVQAGLTAMAEIGADARGRIREGMSVEAEVNGLPVNGHIAGISGYPNPLSGAYSIIMEFEDVAELRGMLIYAKVTATDIKVDEQTIFDKFFAKRLRIQVPQTLRES